MKAATVSQLKKELSFRSPGELLELCLRLSKFKKENKELLTYLLFESLDEEEYIQNIKTEIDLEFNAINTKNFFFIKKSVRKILRNIKKYSRYSLKKETEAELLLYFCSKLKDFKPSIKRNTTLLNLYQRQLVAVKKIISALHEDLQYDYELEVEELEGI
ncbi:hypothetical protein FK178_13680 [Antarcticibacterium arcticum]|uniref:Uncharacterized protein n=1 Tax=Antarcticibacterium arcticum TaxID=2585771 RepID=A0A5B8YRG5_9FLAO|nr:hypothetical protein [Antarcticibacterium arcticum]QED38699.1 hypothetical protein FK178_13680 [Antarcticibacterium arcticum]